jgi:hypothetical protein
MIIYNVKYVLTKDWKPDSLTSDETYKAGMVLGEYTGKRRPDEIRSGWKIKGLGVVPGDFYKAEVTETSYVTDEIKWYTL